MKVLSLAQELINSVKTTNGMTSAEFASAFGFNERTLKSWLLPESSPGHRSMPEDAIDLLRRSLLPKGNHLYFSGFKAGIPPYPLTAVVSDDGLSEFPKMFLVTRRDSRLKKFDADFMLVNANGKTYKCPTKVIDTYQISFSDVHEDAGSTVVSVTPFTTMTPEIAEKLGPRYLYVNEMGSVDAVLGFREALLQASIRNNDPDMFFSFSQCIYKGRIFVVYMAIPRAGAKPENLTRFETLPYLANKHSRTWLKCVDPLGNDADDSGGDSLEPEADWIELTPEEAAEVRNGERKVIEVV